MKTKVWALMLVVFAMLALLLYACGGGASPSLEITSSEARIDPGSKFLYIDGQVRNNTAVTCGHVALWGTLYDQTGQVIEDNRGGSFPDQEGFEILPGSSARFSVLFFDETEFERYEIAVQDIFFECHSSDEGAWIVSVSSGVGGVDGDGDGDGDGFGDTTGGDDQASLASDYRVVEGLYNEYLSIKEDVGIADAASSGVWILDARAARDSLQSLKDEIESLRVNDRFKPIALDLFLLVSAYDSYLEVEIPALQQGDLLSTAAAQRLDDVLKYLTDYRDKLADYVSGSSSSGSGSSIPLYASNVWDFSKGFVRGSGSQLEAANRALDKAIDPGQQVIECQYGPSDPEAQTGYTSYGFWYEDVPDNIDELLRVAGDSGVPDPVFHLGTNSRSSCPDSRDEGEAAWRAGR